MAVAHRPSALHIGSVMKPVKFFLMLPVTFIGLLVVTLIFTVLNKAFWDARVRYLCANEGGVTVYESVDLNDPAYRSIKIALNGTPFIPFENEMDPDDPLYRSSKSDYEQKFGNISIERSELSIVREIDRKTVSKRVTFVRRDGDFITFGSPGSGFSCEDISGHPLELLTQTFNLQGE